MRPKTHEKVMLLIGLISLFLLVPVIQKIVSRPILFLSLVIYAVLWISVLFLVPVSCQRTGCSGRMQRKWSSEPEPADRARYSLKYECPVCLENYDSFVSIGLSKSDES
jgi:hypothetical protein